MLISIPDRWSTVENLQSLETARPCDQTWTAIAQPLCQVFDGIDVLKECERAPLM
jgi:hypothetical protein